MTEMEELPDSLAYLAVTLSSGPNPLVVVISTAGGQTHNHVLNAVNVRRLAANLGKFADHLDPSKIEKPKKERQVIGDAGGKMTTAFDAAEAASAILQNARKRPARRPAKKARKAKRK